MLPRTICTIVPVLLAFVLYASQYVAAEIPTKAELEFFEKEVRPLLVEHCYECHSVDSERLEGVLLLDSRDAMLEGGESGEPAIEPSDAEASLLIKALRWDEYEMPPNGKLSSKQIKTFHRWIEMGAPWPSEAAPKPKAAKPTFDLQQRKADHWVWQPIRAPKIPEVANTKWPYREMDYFVLSRLEAQKLQPAADADRSALLRRIYFDLIGLPPTPPQAAKFLHDTSADAMQRLVDELLDSPHFGERWGRHWLDLVRYAESRGHEFDNDTPNAFQYRDYIIRAFNADIPYDQLVREHIAGDLIESPRLNPDDKYNESVLGTGFWYLGEWVHSPVDIRKDESDRFDNMIDVMSKTFLGVTVSCARCHDHKFDAISTADYYSLSGFLQSSDYRQVRFESLEHNGHIAEQLGKLDARYQHTIDVTLARADVKFPASKPIDDDLADTVVVFDYQDVSKDQYLQDGYIFGRQPRRAGRAYLDNSGDDPSLRFASAGAAVSDSFWKELESVFEQGVRDRSELRKLPRSGRTLRTPTFILAKGKVACRVSGTGHVVACVDSHRLIAGPLHGQTIQPIKVGDQWVELDLTRYIGHGMHLEFTPAAGATLEVSLITQGTSAKVRKQLNQRADAIAATAQTFALQAGRVLADDADELVRCWTEERSKLQKQIMRRSRLAMAMIDGTSEDDHVLLRGNSSTPGDIEPRHFLTAVSGDDPMTIPVGSGRLELARQINDPDNPLTSRVIVNRIWHHLMGRGIVPTTDNFGVLGLRPTHPDLLDHLANQFINDGRNIKRMIRTILLSRTYQMSSQPNAVAIATDPENSLWHHRPPKRLEGEIIRDSLLAISGRLDRTPFGEPVPVHLTAFMDGRGKPGKSGPLDGNGRRSIYIAVRRNFISPFMLAFDTPTPFSTMGRRNVSNVPAQALILMNDPLVVEQAKLWAKRVIGQHSSTEARINQMYRAAFARQPTPQEIAIATAFLTAQSNAGSNELPLWSDFAHVLFNTKEFIFLQ